MISAEGARARIAKLLAIYKDRPDTPEGQNALGHAKRLINKYKQDYPAEAAEEAATAAAPHPEVARIVTAFKSLINTKPVPLSQKTPDFATLEKLFAKMMEPRR